MGSDSFTYDVSDGILTSNVATVSLTVTETAPVAGDVYYTIAENQTLTSSTTSTTSVQAFTTDAQGQPSHVASRDSAATRDIEFRPERVVRLHSKCWIYRPRYVHLREQRRDPHQQRRYGLCLRRKPVDH